MRRSSSPNYVKFGPAEMVVMFATDRGQLRTNDAGEFFYREFTDGRFCCASPDLERQLIQAGVRAGQQVGITRSTFNRAVIWRVRMIGTVAEMPRTVRAAAHSKPRSNGLPERFYAKIEPPLPVWDGLVAAQDSIAANGTDPSKCVPSATSQTPLMANGVQHPEAITPPDGGLLGRCLCEALNACKVAHAHADKVGLPVTFGPAEIERMAVSIFIERTRYGSVAERKPNGTAGSGYVNGKAGVH
jgi:hypothetical protein